MSSIFDSVLKLMNNFFGPDSMLKPGRRRNPAPADPKQFPEWHPVQSSKGEAQGHPLRIEMGSVGALN